MKNNDNITKDVESISYKEVEKEIKWLKNEIYVLKNERDALVKIKQLEVGDWVKLTDGEQWLKPNRTLTVETIQLCNTKRSNK